MSSITLSAGMLVADDAPLLTDLPATVELIADPLAGGTFLRFTADKPAARLVLSAGKLAGVLRFTSLRRSEPFWMVPEVGTRGGAVPVEAQFLIVERAGGSVAVLVPLIGGPFRCSLQGAGDADADGLHVVAESGDVSVVTGGVTGLFVAAGDDPYELIERAARSVNAFVGAGRLREDKPVPAFVDYFGWCTWDAFYQDVSHDKVRAGLQSFRDGGVEPRVVILDDGWQSERTAAAGQRMLTGLAPNAKFGGDLRPTVDMAKREFGVRSLLVWHAMTGYWGGVDPDALPGYGARVVERRSSEGVRHHAPTIDTWWGAALGLVAPEHAYRFFHDYHRSLRAQGVDGVKVDVQAQLEAVAGGYGGRVALMRRYREALEGSAQVHFGGALINCMSCSTDMLYAAAASTVTRTSTDFWPNKPESHGLHLYTNAQVSAWFGQFVLPDWDMFQSGHPMGAYHAAGRAVGGCPVYVSDKPGAHDFAVLRKLVLPDGRVLRCPGPGRPTRDCLFRDPTREDVLLKVFNRNAVGGVIGAFNCRYGGPGTPTPPVGGTVAPTDVDGLAGERFAVYAHAARTLRAVARDGRVDVTLPELGWEVFTITPVVNGVAAIGLLDMLNAGGAVRHVAHTADGACRARVTGPGRFGAYCEHRPKAVTVAGRAVPSEYDAGTRLLVVDIPEAGGAVEVLIDY